MDAVTGERDSRAATDALLAGLRAGGFRPRAWSRFVGATCARSLGQARGRPRAVAEVALLHGALGVLAAPRRRWWVATSAALALTHLGMLERRRSIGVPNALSLVRANLPALAHRLGPAALGLALATDFTDGRLARRSEPTRFGAAADFLADTAFWGHHAATGGLPRPWQAATAAAWLAPVVVVTATSFARGGMVDVPRWAWFRPAGALQVVLAARALHAALRARR